MALHGDIRVNHQLVGWWEATRTHTSADGYHTYEYTVTGSKGGPQRGEVRHQFTDGAVTLAGLVLAAAAEQALVGPGGED